VAQAVTSLVTRQGTDVREIRRLSETMLAATHEVAASTAGQRAAADLVVKAAETITRVARQNVVSVEEISSSARRLTESATALDLRIKVFKVDDVAPPGRDQATAPPSRPMPPPPEDVAALVRTLTARDKRVLRPAAAMVSAR
jgi:hypothetical protein